MGTEKTIAQAATSFEEGQWTAANTNPAPLVSGSKPCKRVYLAAPVDDAGAAVNAGLVRFGGDATGAQLAGWIATNGSRDVMVHIDDASKLTLKAGTGGDKVNYRIEY